MKILHTADWHLGKKLEHFSRLEEQIEVLDEICEIANEQAVDLVIVAGDLYDKINPSTEAQKLLFKTLKRLTNNGKRPVIAIAGNHDSPELFEAPDPLALECGIFLLAYPDSEIETIKLETGVEITASDKGFLSLKLPQYNYPIRIIATPYANEHRLKKMFEIDDKEAGLRTIVAEKWENLANKYCDDKGVNILTTHLFIMKEGTKNEEIKEPDGEKPIVIGGASAVYTSCIPPQIQYTALGHLHRYQNISGAGCPVIYSSSPIAYSFAEANQIKKVAIVELEPKKEAIVTPIDLQKGKKLLRKFDFESVEEAVIWLAENENALVEIKINKETYLTGEEFQQLKQTHNGIVHIIPPDFEFAGNINSEQNAIDLQKDTDTLFEEYFKYKNKGQAPNEKIWDLFKEVKALKG